MLFCLFSWQKALLLLESPGSIEIHRVGVNELQTLETSVENVTGCVEVLYVPGRATHARFGAWTLQNIRKQKDRPRGRCRLLLNQVHGHVDDRRSAFGGIELRPPRPGADAVHDHSRQIA